MNPKSADRPSVLTHDVPPATPRRCCAQWARVARTERVCRAHVALEFEVPEFPAAEPGQFVELLCRERADERLQTHDWPDETAPPALCDPELRTRSAFLRRPFSLADQWTDAHGSVHLLVISRTIGVGTSWLEHLQVGDSVDVTGPLGKPFLIPEEPRPLLLVGGGVGIPPLLFLARRLHERSRAGVSLVFGATSADLLPVARIAEPSGDAANPTCCLALPGGASFPAILTTDDGTLGVRGRVTDGIAAWWDAHRRREHGTPMVLACGPEPMLAAIARQARQLGFDAQLCIERPMGCGLGTCLSCVVRVHDLSRSAGWRWALTCTEGPVFDRDALLDFDSPDA